MQEMDRGGEKENEIRAFVDLVRDMDNNSDLDLWCS